MTQFCVLLVAYRKLLLRTLFDASNTEGNTKQSSGLVQYDICSEVSFAMVYFRFQYMIITQH